MEFSSRKLAGSMLLLLISSEALFAAPNGLTPQRTYDVAPIPLAFADEEEEIPPPNSAGREDFRQLPKPIQTDDYPSLELSPPVRSDPFSRPGFDPFDDEQFKPEGIERPQDRSQAPFENNLPGPKRSDIFPLDLPAVGPDADNGSASSVNGRQTIRERYPSGAVKIEREMIQDSDGNYLLDGAWRWFSEKGQLIADGEYSRDQRQGVWRRTFTASEEALFRTAPYNQFKAPFHSEATFSQGKLNGAWTIYDSQQRKISDIFYEEGKRHGPAMWWQVRGTPVIQANFEKGELHGEAYVFDSNGKMIRRDQYEQGWKYDRKTDKHPNGKVKEVTSWLGGHWKLAGEDDWWNARIASFEVVEQPMRHGQQLTYYPNGQLRRQQEFKRGKPIGEMVYWHENGQRALTGHFSDNGQPEGQWTWWHENGLRSIAGEYLAGSPQGDWTWWNAEGKITRRGELDASDSPPEIIASSPGQTTLGRPRPAD